MAEITITAHESGARIDKLISESDAGISRSLAAKLCEDGKVTVVGKAVSKNYKTKAGDIIAIDIPEAETIEAVPQDIPLDIIYEDADVIVINKPQGMVVHPAAGNPDGTLVNALMFHCGDSLSAINGVIRPGIVHRIDKDTSGLLVAAKNDAAHNSLAAQLKERKALRKYIALVNGNIKEDELTIDKPLSRNPADRKKMAIVQGGREAVTHVRVLERFGQYTLVECVLETGRTHQIRVHMAAIGHPMAGDFLYGAELPELPGRFALHSAAIEFDHPLTGARIALTSPLPEALRRLMDP